MVINKLIPADQLHWSEEERAYLPISMQEVNKISSLCGGLTHEQTVAVVMDYQEYKVGHLLWRNFMDGKIKISGVDQNGKPLFVPVDL